IECWTIDAPAAVRQIFPIELAVVEINRRLQRDDRVEALQELIAIWSCNRRVREANASGVSTFQVLALMTDLRLGGVSGSAVSRRRHAEDPVVRVTRIFEESHVCVQPLRAGHAGPAVNSANDPAVLFELVLVCVSAGVE